RDRGSRYDDLSSPRARESRGCNIHDSGGNNMRFLQAVYRTALATELHKNRIEGRRCPGPVVTSEIEVKRIFAGMGVIEARQSKIFPDLALGIAVRICASTREPVLQDFRTIRRGPEIVGVRQHAQLEVWNRSIHARSIRKKTETGLRVGHNRSAG